MFSFMVNVSSESAEIKQYQEVVKYNQDCLENIVYVLTVHWKNYTPVVGANCYPICRIKFRSIYVN